MAKVEQPVHASAPRSEPNNLYIVERTGKIRVRVRGRLRARPFLDLSNSISTGSEQGLLSVAFHPRYARNRLFYVDYTDRNEDTRIVEYRSRGLTRKPVRTRQIFFQDDPYSNHNGGQLAFGPDGYLYAATGDGGSGGDPENRAQNLQFPLRQAPPLQRQPAQAAAGDHRLRPAQPLALLLRPANG